MSEKPWWEEQANLKPSQHGPEQLAQYWASGVLLKRAIAEGKVVHRTGAEGMYEGKVEEFEKLLEPLMGKVMCRSVDVEPETPADVLGGMVLAWDNAIAVLSFQSGGWIEISFYSLDPELGKKFVEITREVLKKRGRPREVYVVVRGEDGYSLSSLGKHGLPIERGNYEPAVVEGFDHIIEDMKTATPCGRVILLDGPPGSGKTHLVRAIVQEVEGTFVLLPAQVLQKLSGPDMVSTLLENRRSSKGPIVLILEDADECLAPRKFDNITSVSELLNLGDGILGGALDIRIIATTNTPRAEIDKAILRPGRMCRRMDVGILSEDVANAALERLGSAERVKGKTVLADVYRLAGNRGSNGAATEQAGGFNVSK